MSQYTAFIRPAGMGKFMIIAPDPRTGKTMPATIQALIEYDKANGPMERGQYVELFENEWFRIGDFN